LKQIILQNKILSNHVIPIIIDVNADVLLRCVGGGPL